MNRDQPDILISLGGLSSSQEDYSKALSYYQEALVMALEQENNSEQSRAQTAMSILYLRQGNERRAYHYLKEGLLLGRDLRLFECVHPLIGMTGLSVAGGEPQRAAILLGTADSVLKMTHTNLRYFPSVYPEYKRIKAQVREQLDESTFNRLAEEGRALAAEGMDRIIEFAL